MTGTKFYYWGHLGQVRVTNELKSLPWYRGTLWNSLAGRIIMSGNIDYIYCGKFGEALEKTWRTITRFPHPSILGCNYWRRWRRNARQNVAVENFDPSTTAANLACPSFARRWIPRRTRSRRFANLVTASQLGDGLRSSTAVSRESDMETHSGPSEGDHRTGRLVRLFDEKSWWFPFVGGGPSYSFPVSSPAGSSTSCYFPIC